MRYWKSIGKMLSVSSVLSLFAILLAGISSCEAPTGDLAIKGYDTVAYFTVGKAVKGDAAFTSQWRGMTWHFASRENRELFESSPGAYAPQYDGYCAWALTESRKAITNPDVWKIVKGKLYLNCSKEAYDKWSRDIPGNIEKADRNWLKLSGEGKDKKP